MQKRFISNKQLGYKYFFNYVAFKFNYINRLLLFLCFYSIMQFSWLRAIDGGYYYQTSVDFEDNKKSSRYCCGICTLKTSACYSSKISNSLVQTDKRTYSYSFHMLEYTIWHSGITFTIKRKIITIQSRSTNGFKRKSVYVD